MVSHRYGIPERVMVQEKNLGEPLPQHESMTSASHSKQLFVFFGDSFYKITRYIILFQLVE